jgi:hypothetical protein
MVASKTLVYFNPDNGKAVNSYSILKIDFVERFSVYQTGNIA